ncbi:MAG: hypothetical protein RLZZ501_371 [Pseudomonadota bacterium]|jgi:proteasome lid subunit RPN8/RPN11
MILLAAAEAATIAAHAEAAFPGEGCGLLAGTGTATLRVTRVVPAANLCAGQRDDRFEIDPAARFALARALRGTPERLIGHWHSHPNGRAAPSPTDLARAWEPELVWLIVPVAADDDGRPRAGTPRAFRLDGGRGVITPVTLRLT